MRWILDIDTREGVAPTEEDFNRLVRALTANASLEEPLVALEPRRLSIRLIVGVEAPDAARAADIAEAALTNALADAGLAADPAVVLEIYVRAVA